jgi:hypothetical protein
MFSFARRFRFGLRTVLIVLALLALGCALLGGRFREGSRRADLVRRLERAGGQVDFYDASSIDHFTMRLLGAHNYAAPVHAVDFRGGRPAFVDEVRTQDVSDVEDVSIRNAHITRRMLRELAGWPNIRRLFLWRSTIEDDAFIELGRMRQLRRLIAGHCKFNPREAAILSQCSQLEHLDLRFTPIDDSTCAAIARLKNLQVLVLSFTNCSDVGVEAISGLNNLTYLGISGTRVTDRGIASAARLSLLRDLDAEYLPLTDDALSMLASCRDLRDVNVTGNQITKEGIDKFLMAETTSRWRQVCYNGAYRRAREVMNEQIRNEK